MHIIQYTDPWGDEDDQNASEGTRVREGGREQVRKREREARWVSTYSRTALSIQGTQRTEKLSTSFLLEYWEREWARGSACNERERGSRE